MQEKANSECMRTRVRTRTHTHTHEKGEEQQIALGRWTENIKNLFIRERSLSKVARLTEDIPLSQI